MSAREDYESYLRERGLAFPPLPANLPEDARASAATLTARDAYFAGKGAEIEGLQTTAAAKGDEIARAQVADREAIAAARAEVAAARDEIAAIRLRCDDAYAAEQARKAGAPL